MLVLAGAITLQACGAGDQEVQRQVIVVEVPQNSDQRPTVASSPTQGGASDTDDRVIIVVNGGDTSTPADNNTGGTDDAAETTVDDSPAGITDLVLITGQSNALGTETAFDPVLDAPVERFYAWTEDSGWQPASLRQIWDLGWHPQTDPDTDPHNNFGLHFGKGMVEASSDRVVGIVLASAPGEGISHWDYNTWFYNVVSDKAIAALNDLPHKTGFDGILWHQGESDWVANGSSDPDLGGAIVGADYYRDKLYSLIANFRSENWFGEGRPFICGETAQAPLNVRLNELNNDGDEWTACTEGEGLPTYDAPENVHFNAEGLRQLGRNYAQTYLRMTAANR